ncbi:MAG: HEAT repeat domain-containing protein [Taibaiella sp.]|nr:HEAT repeat domain-containing protein [Taibaiella sp.]
MYEKRLKNITPVINDLITEQVLLNESLQNEYPVDSIVFDPAAIGRPIFQKPWVRAALIKALLGYKRNFGGDLGALLRKLYIDMDLQNDSFNKIDSSRWYRKIQGIVELTQMEIRISDVTILPLTNSKIPELRVAARNAYLQISKNNPFKFFDIATEPLLPWDRLEMFKIITTTKDIAIPNFSRWISYSTNKSIVSFCLELIAHYSQHNAIPAVMHLIDTNDHFLRARAINCLGKLRAEEAEDKFIEIYTNQPINCQLEIIKALGRINSGRYIEFLKHEFLYSFDFYIRKNAARAIIRNVDIGSDTYNDLMRSSSTENQLILKHCSNPLIKY